MTNDGDERRKKAREYYAEHLKDTFEIFLDSLRFSRKSYPYSLELKRQILKNLNFVGRTLLPQYRQR